MIRVLLADPDNRVFSAFQGLLKPYSMELCICEFRYSSMLEELKSGRYQAALIGQGIPGHSLVELYRTCQSAAALGALRPVQPLRFFAILPHENESLTEFLLNCGFSGTLAKPFSDLTLLRLLENVLWPPCGEDARLHSLEQRISETLVLLGCPVHLSGFRYLQRALLLIAQDPNLMVLVTKRLYPMVGQDFNTSGCNVERAMRTALDQIWRFGNTEMLQRCFPCTSRGPVCAQRFLSTMALYLAQAMRRESAPEDGDMRAI